MRSQETWSQSCCWSGCGALVHVRRGGLLWVAAAAPHRGAPPSGWMLLPSQSMELGWESTGWILVSTCLLGHRPLHSAQSIHLFLHLSWNSGAALLSASCMTSRVWIWVSSVWTEHCIWGPDTWVGVLPPLLSHNMTLSKSLTSVGPNFLVWKVEVGKSENSKNRLPN